MNSKIDYISLDDLGLLSSAYITQLLNELYLYNLNDCLYYGYQIADHVTLVVGETSELSIG